MQKVKILMGILGAVAIVSGYGIFAPVSIGYLCLLCAVFVVDIVDSAIRQLNVAKIRNERISDFERRVFGKVITIDDYRKCKGETPKETVTLDKETKYQIAQAKMEKLRQTAPPLKPKKTRHSKVSKSPSLKERAGGVRRAS